MNPYLHWQQIERENERMFWELLSEASSLKIRPAMEERPKPPIIFYEPIELTEEDQHALKLLRNGESVAEIGKRFGERYAQARYRIKLLRERLKLETHVQLIEYAGKVALPLAA